MNTFEPLWANVDEDGHLDLPPDVMTQFGIEPGTRLRLEMTANGLKLHRPVTHLAKIYIEPTNRCNIDCRTCMRQNWDVTLGKMSAKTFAAIEASLAELTPPVTVMFGGIGEPLLHPQTADMIAAVKALGFRAEMITNGTLLTERRAKQLIEAGLDLLWVSIDGSSPESYADVRLGAELPRVLENLRRFRRLRRPAHRPTPEIGIAFVAMQRNIADLPEVLRIGKSVGAKHFSVSNLLPHSAEMEEEILYKRSMRNITYLPSSWLRRLSLPKMDFNEMTAGPLMEAFNSGYNVSFAGNNLGEMNDVCTFIEQGAMAVGWDGRIAPCPPLLYHHIGYIRGYRRESFAHILGDIHQQSLQTLWQTPAYEAYRDRVQRFAFAPCTACGGCELLENNETDCFWNEAPACGSCLWAQGFVQCP
ncbi:MAG: radical SAM protein [Candidatus Promineifilaceae bacterium]|nr:radical SAM protein [Anaerolineaceae bacterium]